MGSMKLKNKEKNVKERGKQKKKMKKERRQKKQGLGGRERKKISFFVLRELLRVFLIKVHCQGYFEVVP